MTVAVEEALDKSLHELYQWWGGRKAKMYSLPPSCLHRLCGQVIHHILLWSFMTPKSRWLELIIGVWACGNLLNSDICLRSWFWKHAKVVSWGQLLAWLLLQCFLESSLQPEWRIFKKPKAVLYHLNKDISSGVPILFSPKLSWFKAFVSQFQCLLLSQATFFFSPCGILAVILDLWSWWLFFFCGEEGKSSTEDFWLEKL